MSVSIAAPSGDESQCMTGYGGRISVLPGEEGLLSASIKCTIKFGRYFG